MLKSLPKSKGLMVLVGIEDSDTPEDISWLTSKL
jgi:D-Tyr-tRNAtyr deacylase